MKIKKYLTHETQASIISVSERFGKLACTQFSNSDSQLVSMNAGLANEVIFLDRWKALDTVDHEILIKNL